MRKLDYCVCKNKGADQLCSNCTADQCLCFCYSHSTILLPVKSSMTVQAGLCQEMVGNREDRFSRVVAQWVFMFLNNRLILQQKLRIWFYLSLLDWDQILE